MDCAFHLILVCLLQCGLSFLYISLLCTFPVVFVPFPFQSKTFDHVSDLFCAIYASFLLSRCMFNCLKQDGLVSFYVTNCHIFNCYRRTKQDWSNWLIIPPNKTRLVHFTIYLVLWKFYYRWTDLFLLYWIYLLDDNLKCWWEFNVAQ